MKTEEATDDWIAALGCFVASVEASGFKVVVVGGTVCRFGTGSEAHNRLLEANSKGFLWEVVMSSSRPVK